jgi:pimeloyl-ACP methyl ester carboxylesterase
MEQALGTKQAFTSRRIGVIGITLNVVVEGEGPDVMLVHGSPTATRSGANRFRHWSPPVTASSRPIFAASATACADEVSAYKVPHFADDLRGVLDALGIAKVRLVGHDWGAVSSWAFVINHPERVDRYVAMSVGHPSAYPRGGLAQKLKGYYVLMLQLRGIAEFLLKAADWRFFRLITSYDAEFPLWKAEMSRPGRLTAAINIYRANLGLILPREYPKVKVPVLGVWSSRDIALARKQMVISGEYVDAPWRYEQIDGANHWMQLDAPDKVNALLLDYLR